MPSARETSPSGLPKENGHGASLKEHKIVVHLRTGSVFKGHISCGADPDPAAMFEDAEVSGIDIRLLETAEWVHIPIDEVKAIFFVKSFRGDSKRKTLRFYTNGPDLGPIWAEIRFQDNEVLEGKIDNTARHLAGNGLVVHPTDADGNNLLVYVNKKAVRGYRVLGIRTHHEAHD
jgi:hypothetical protein